MTAADALLATRTPALARHRVDTADQLLTLPSLTRGRIYCLRVIVDGDATLLEVRKGNNATYVGIQVKRGSLPATLLPDGGPDVVDRQCQFAGKITHPFAGENHPPWR